MLPSRVLLTRSNSICCAGNCICIAFTSLLHIGPCFGKYLLKVVQQVNNWYITSCNLVGQMLCIPVHGTHCQKCLRPSNFLCSRVTHTHTLAVYDGKGLKGLLPPLCVMHLRRRLLCIAWQSSARVCDQTALGGVNNHRPSVCMSSIDIYICVTDY